MKLDEIDMEILQILEKNGRISNKEIAEAIQVSEGTVRNRIKKLMENNFLKVKGLTNPNERMDKQLIFILVKLEVTKNWKEIARRVSELPNVKAVSMITGRFDLVIELFTHPHKLISFLTEDLSNIEAIASTESLLCIKSFNKWI